MANASKHLVTMANTDGEPETAAKSTASLARSAQWYARSGYQVFALRPRAKEPATAHGCMDATTDMDVIARMWSDPVRNVAIATGAASGVVVVDVDGADGEASLAALVRTHGELPVTPEARTGRGRHLYFAHPGEGRTVKNSAGKLGQGIDVRGDGGYVVAPPSIHPSGAVYTWTDGGRPDEIRPAALPRWLLEALTAEPRHAPARDSQPMLRAVYGDAYGRTALERECEDVASAAEGTRNARLNEAAFSAGQLVAGACLDEAVAHAGLLDAARRAGLPDREARATIGSGMAAGMCSPRRAPEREPSNGHAAPRLHGQHVSEPEPWAEPIPLRAHGELPRFPIDCLPEWLREWVAAESHATQTPPDMAAMLALAVLATCCGRRLRVRVRDGWHEPMNLYACVVLPPGNRKSAVFSDARAPIDAYERELTERLAPEIRDTAAAYRIAEQRRDAAERAAAKANGPDRMLPEQEARETNAALDIAKCALVRAPRLTCGDVTQEALARVLEQQGERIAVMDAEGCGPIALMLGRYSDGAASVDLYLRGHAVEPYRCDRVGRDPVDLRSPTITLAITVQPEVLRQLGERQEVRGLGLLARILWCVPVSTVGGRAAEPEPVPESVRANYARHVGMLLELLTPTDGEPNTIRLSAPAWFALRTLMERLEPQLGLGGKLEHVADWAAKLAGAVARIAALLHAAEHPSAPWAVEVSADAMVRAVAIGDYLLAHALAALGSMGADPVIADAEHVLAWLRAGALRQVSRRDLWHAHRGRFPRSELIEPALGVLAERGWIRAGETPTRTGPGRRPSPIMEVHSRAWSTDHIDHNDHNADGANGRGNSGQCGQCGHGSQVLQTPAPDSPPPPTDGDYHGEPEPTVVEL